MSTHHPASPPALGHRTRQDVGVEKDVDVIPATLSGLVWSGLAWPGDLQQLVVAQLASSARLPPPHPPGGSRSELPAQEAARECSHIR